MKKERNIFKWNRHSSKSKINYFHGTIPNLLEWDRAEKVRKV